MVISTKEEIYSRVRAYSVHRVCYFIFLFFYKFIYLFTFGCVGFSFLCVGFL